MKTGTCVWQPFACKHSCRLSAVALQMQHLCHNLESWNHQCIYLDTFCSNRLRNCWHVALESIWWKSKQTSICPRGYSTDNTNSIGRYFRDTKVEKMSWLEMGGFWSQVAYSSTAIWCSASSTNVFYMKRNWTGRTTVLCVNRKTFHQPQPVKHL